MKPLRSTLAAFIAAVVLTVSAAAADISGNWKWTIEGRNGPIEATAALQFKDGVLTGTVGGRFGDTAIGDASFTDDQVSFTVTREFNGNKFVIKYDGKLENDTITGTITRPNRDGGTTSVDWKATRAN